MPNPPEQSDAVEIRLADVLSRHLGAAYEPLKTFAAAPESERLKAGRKIIAESIINASEEPDVRFRAVVDESESLLKEYATLDEPHRDDIQRMIRNIKDYLDDSTRKRPFNALMSASPGTGKSHFIRQLANSMKDQGVQAVTFNMATMQSPDDMAQPLDELRNLKVRDQFPLLFLDEFDSDSSRYASLLPLLWDGELHIGHRDLKLGKAVIVLAGSDPDLPRAMDPSTAAQLDEKGTGDRAAAKGKLVDLLSRINGGMIEIPDLDLCTADRDRRVDKVCVTVTLLRRRFGAKLARIPRSLLRFVASTRFRYAARSIAHLVDAIDRESYENGEMKAGDLGLPFTNEQRLRESSLRLHLIDPENDHGIVNRWNAFSADRSIASLEQRLPLWMFK